MSDEFPKPSGDCITDRIRQNRAQAKAESSLSASNCSGADVAAKLGVSLDEMRSMIKPLVILMHRNRLPSITINLDKGIATFLTVKPPNDKAQRPGHRDAGQT